MIHLRQYNQGNEQSQRVIDAEKRGKDSTVYLFEEGA